nr:store-operated calcium entry-associated regulatory factor [Ipomoea batatas]
MGAVHVERAPAGGTPHDPPSSTVAPLVVLGSTTSRHLGRPVAPSRPSTYNGVMYSNTTKSGTPDGASKRGMDYKNKSSMFEVGERAETPCNFSSSIYYGAQEVYSPTTSHTTHHTNYFKKEEVEDDENGNNSNCASRGDWWQGMII